MIKHRRYLGKYAVAQPKVHCLEIVAKIAVKKHHLLLISCIKLAGLIQALEVLCNKDRIVPQCLLFKYCRHKTQALEEALRL